MNKKKIIILSICLVFLLGVLALVMALPDSQTEQETTDTPDTSADYTEETIYTVSVDSVTSVSVFFSGEAYTLVKTSDGWICSEKPNVQVSQSRVTSLMSELCSLRYADKLDTAKVAPADCGITDTSDYVSFESDNGTITVYKGNNVTDSQLCYIMTSLSDDIYMVKQDRVSRMFVPFDEYRSDHIARIDFDNITAIDFKNSKCSFSIVKGEYNIDTGNYYAWKMTSPIAVLAKDSEIDSKLISPVSSISVDDYVNDNGDFANYGLGDKSNYITFTDVSGKTQTVYFSLLLNNKYYICVDDGMSIYEIAPSSAPFADLSLIDIADRQLYLTKQSNLASLTIDGSGKAYDIIFKDDGSITVNSKKNDSDSATREIFSAVCGPLADDISTDAMGAAVLTMKFELKDSSQVTLTFAEKNERYYSVAKDGKPLYSILKSKLDSMFATLDKYKG